MSLPYIDSNVLIRYITRDNPGQSALAGALIDKLEDGSATATTCEAVLLEVVQVLSSRRLYNLPRQDISTYLTHVVSLKGLKMTHKRAYLRALSLYASLN